MRIRLLSIALVGALAAPASAHAQAPTLSARTSECTVGLTAVERVVTFTGAMPAIAGSKRMSMRFDLQIGQRAVGPYRATKVPGLGVWRSTTKGRSGFVYTQRVQTLVVPAFYRARVTFRWQDAAARTLRTVRRTTKVCAQPDLRPDLRPGRLTAVRLPDGQARYTLVVRNDGRSVAAPAGISLDVAGAPAPVSATAPQIGPRSATSVLIDAPPCAPGSTVQLVVDPARLIDESDEADNAIVRACPFRPAR